MSPENVMSEHVIKEVASPCLIDYHVLSVYLVASVVLKLKKFVVTSNPE